MRLVERGVVGLHLQCRKRRGDRPDVRAKRLDVHRTAEALTAIRQRIISRGPSLFRAYDAFDISTGGRVETMCSTMCLASRPTPPNNAELSE